jgi:hypothetical protein
MKGKHEIWNKAVVACFPDIPSAQKEKNQPIKES